MENSQKESREKLRQRLSQLEQTKQDTELQLIRLELGVSLDQDHLREMKYAAKEESIYDTTEVMKQISELLNNKSNAHIPITDNKLRTYCS